MREVSFISMKGWKKIRLKGERGQVFL